jgi:signal transduction histidine kinase
MDRREHEAAAALRRQAERLATLARLARPVQHEINNLLTVIFANLEMLKRSAAEGAPQRQLDRIAEAARRFDASTRALLMLSRRPVPGEGAAVPLAEAVESLRPLLAVLLPAPGALTLEVGTGGWPARFDRALLDEALLRLAVEVSDAAPRGAGLAVVVANRPGGGGGGRDRVELTVALPPCAAASDQPPAALDALRALAQAGGGEARETVAEAGRTLALSLPRHVEAEAEAAPA